MRKKSHILLARYLADQMKTTESLQLHRKAFCFGNILPDIRPSFVTKRHEFFGTFDEIQDKIKELISMRPEQLNERVYWRRFGEVMHYMADYFTFPHNKTYKGSFSEHNHYEKILKDRLKACITSGQAYQHLEEAIPFRSTAHLMDYIRTSHAHYLAKLRNVQEDIHFILNVCFQVVQGIVRLCIGDAYSADLCVAAVH